MGGLEALASKPVLQFSKGGELLGRVSSPTEAAKMVCGTKMESIWKCCNGYTKTSGGYIWEYENPLHKSSTDNVHTHSICTNCGVECRVQKWRLEKRKNIFCSKKCSDDFSKIKTTNCSCFICGKGFHRKQSHMDKNGKNYCSYLCHNEAKKKYMSGELNHQFGLLGDLNSSWRSDTRISVYGYRLVRDLEHPFKNVDGFVFEHRMVAEAHLLEPEWTVEVGGKKYLDPEYVVHHKDHDRLNNDVDNLEVMKRSEHTRMHVSKRDSV